MTNRALHLDFAVHILSRRLPLGADDFSAQSISTLHLGLDVRRNVIQHCISLRLKVAIERADLRRGLEWAREQGLELVQCRDGG